MLNLQVTLKFFKTFCISTRSNNADNDIVALIYFDALMLQCFALFETINLDIPLRLMKCLKHLMNVPAIKSGTNFI